MAVRTNRLEQAVEALLCPRHYEFLLFLQKEIDKNGGVLAVTNRERCRTVMRIVEREKGSSVHLSSVDEAAEVLEEALRRLQ